MSKTGKRKRRKKGSVLFEAITMRERFDFLVSVVSRKSARVAAYHLDQLGITPRHYAVMAIIDGQRMSQISITGRLGLNKNVMVNLIDDLETKFLCRRVQNPANRREYHIQLTERGREFLREADQLVVRAQKEFLQPLSMSERTQLCTLLGKLMKDELDSEKTK
jgi:DNA-binding MarR family transcriptional regulator